MFPTLFHIPFLDYPVSSFGVMMAIGFLAAAAISSKRMTEEGLDPELASTMLIWCMVGGVLGAKIYFTIDVGIREGIPFSRLFFDRAGITWYGGLMGGIAASAIGCRVHGIPFIKFLNTVAVGAAVGQSLGRIGCFLVGDDYGRPTDVPWAVAFPEGAPPTHQAVHPTQLYEVLWLLPVAGVLWWRRHRSPFLAGEYLMANGAGRIVIEHWRVNPTVALGLTEPQWIGIALIVSGLSGWLYFASRKPASA
ncbi:MAG: prolipoprotein diacylglyceryl transferase [Proteobacteria bacterium]|nr:prolipoprotein diacylglyceryl transferase [Pseudomonadota bacterium]